MPAEKPSRYAQEANRLYEKATNKLRNRMQAYDDGAWRVVRQARRWMPQWVEQEQPFFAFLHFMEPHIRYSAPGEYHLRHMPKGVTPQRAAAVNQDPWKFLTGQTEMTEEDFAILAGLYDGEISYVDSRIGELHRMLTDSGLMENTVFVITSDHGENLGEHGLMDHAYCLYDTLVNVPLIIQGPEGFPAGQRVSRPVQSAGLFATVLRLAGLDEDPAWQQVQARDSLLANDVAQGSAEERYTFAEYREPQPPLAVLKRRFDGFDGGYFDRSLRMIRNEKHKYIWTSDGFPELYDLAKDPGESQNIANIERERAEAMAREMEDRLGKFEVPNLSDEGLDLDDDTVKKLEQLGYLA
jgi:arylsulfatase A-like enzyme